MHLEFARNTEPTLGIELELTLVDAETGELASAATDLLTELGVGHPEGVHPKAKHELFECTIEIITGVCKNPREARDDLAATLAEVRAVAATRGLVPLSIGTHPYSSWRDQQVSPKQRYHELVEELQWTARRLAIFGVHYHVAVRSGEQAIAVVNALRGYLPYFVALSASSPYWENEDSGLASSRIKIFESLPTAGLSPRLEGWSEFERLMDTLIAARCIRSIQEIWWDVRPHPTFGTVELRMCDAPATLREVAAIGALAQCLVHSLSLRHEAGDFPELPSEWTVRENKWLAARHGLDAELIADAGGDRRPARELIAELVTEMRPVAAQVGATRQLSDIARILDHGAGYARQRAARARGASPRELVRLVAEELETDEPMTS
jgi:glutamate---cysteine ligase / carboxylate-amine ligase